MSDSTFVLYHGDADGFGSAWAAHRFLGDDPDVLYIATHYGQPPPAEIWGGIARLFILDFSYPRALMERLANASREILCVDHHKTAAEELAGLPYVHIDQSKSGAVLTWEHFFPDRDVPHLLRYVQDRDLWRWELPESKAYNFAIASYPLDFPSWDWLRETMDGDGIGHRILVTEGEAIARYQAKAVASLAAKAHPLSVGGYTVPTVNSACFQSELGEELCFRHPDAPFSATYYIDESTNRMIYSLRSRNGFDVSAVAKAHGGGGHKAAAGFSLKMPASWP